HRDVPERIQDQEQEDGGGGDGHPRDSGLGTRDSGEAMKILPRWGVPAGDRRVTQACAYSAGSRASWSWSAMNARPRRAVRIGPGWKPLIRGPLAPSSACSIGTSVANACWTSP